MTQPTSEQLAAADLVAVTPAEFAEVIANGWPLRDFNGEKFPPISIAYASKNWKTVKPPPATFTATQTGANEITVSWTNVSPIELARDGVDLSGFKNWNTGPLTNEPLNGSFAFDFLVQGNTYVFTLTEKGGATLTAQCSVTAPPTPTKPVLGMNGGGLTWGGDTSTNDAAFELMKTLGAKYVRIALPWNYSTDPSWTGFYNSDGTFNETILQEVATTKTLAESYGLTPLFLVDGLISLTEPAAGAACYTAGLPYLPADYAKAIAWLVAGVKGLHVELVNEPDGFGTWKGPVALPASTLASALPLVWDAVQVADPTAIIHMAPVSGVQPGTGGYIFRTALAAALPNYGDFFHVDGYHEYTYPINEPYTTEAGWASTFIFAFIKGKFWVTEFGFPSLTTNSNDNEPEATPAWQATQLVGAIQADFALPTPPEVIMIYCLQDYGVAGPNAGYWGLVDSTWPDGDTNPKPAFAAVQALFA